MKKIFYSLCLIFMTTTFITAQSNFGVEANGGIKFPLGSFSDVWKPLFGGSFLCTYDLKGMSSSLSDLQIMIEAGYYQANVSSTFNDNYSKLLGVTVTIDWPLSLIPVSIGGRYFLMEGKFRPFIEASVGVMMMKIRKVSISSATGTVSNNSDQTDNGLLFNAGIGAQYALGPKLELNLNAKYEGLSLQVVEPINNKSANLNSFALNLGISYKF